jgi:hypothetical protein
MAVLAVVALATPPPVIVWRAPARLVKVITVVAVLTTLPLGMVWAVEAEARRLSAALLALLGATVETVQHRQ